MKTILCLTDFTQGAENAAKTAAYFASKLKTNLFVFNSCFTAPVVTAYGGGSWVIDEILERQEQGNHKLKTLKNRLADTMAHRHHDVYHPTIQVECGEGRLGVNVDEIISERKVELVVIGAKHGKQIHNFFSGSETAEVINHAKRPILIVPENIELKDIQNVIFATDFNEEDHKALSYLSEIGLKLGFHIELVHIKLLNKKTIIPFERKLFLDKVFGAHYSNVSFKEFTGKELSKRLTALCEGSNIEILAMMHHQHSFFIRLFQHSVTSEILTHQTVPLLVIPSGMCN